MRRKILSAGFALFLVVALSFHFLTAGAELPVLKSWLRGNRFMLNNSRITLNFQDYILPHQEGNPVLIREVLSGPGVLEISTTGLSIDEGRAFVLNECKVKSCVSISQRMSMVNRKKVLAIELQFNNSQTGGSLEAFYWVEGLPVFIRFNGPTDVYPHYRTTISNIINQVSH